MEMLRGTIEELRENANYWRDEAYARANEVAKLEIENNELYARVESLKEQLANG